MLVCLLLLLWLQHPASLAREHVKKGLELSQKGDLQSANVYLEKALKLEPNDIEALYYLAVNQYRLEQFAPAKTNLVQTLSDRGGCVRTVSDTGHESRVSPDRRTVGGGPL